MKRFLATVPILVATIWSVSAQAQEQVWLADRRYREGPGYRVGDFELHPGIGAEFGYETNYYLRAPDEDPIGALRLRVSPHFSLSTLGPQRRGDGPPPSVAFRAGISLTYNEFIPVSGSERGRDSLQDERNLSGNLNLALDILPEREFSGRLWGAFARIVQPTNETHDEADFNRLTPHVGGELIWAPGGGMIDWRLGYTFTGTVFESGDFSNLSHLQHDISTSGRWKFLPRTALMYDMRQGIVTYPAGTQKTASYPLRSRLGLNGLLTPTLGVLLMAGWGASFYAGDQEDFDSVIGQLELKWYLTPNPEADPMAVTNTLSWLAGGFVRNFEDAYIGTYQESDRGYANFSYLFASTFLLMVEGGVAAIVYPLNPSYGQPSGWTDVRIDGKIFAEYRILDSVGINTTIGYDGYLSSTRVSFPNVPGSNALKYHNFSAFLGGRWFM